MKKGFTEHLIIFDSLVKKGMSAWIMHSPFAFFLVSILKPKLFVELGVHTGHSYNAFCQAVKALKTGTCCYGIDTWKGDKHAGFYSEDVYQQLLEYQLKEYSEFSHLLRMTFDEGLANFSNQSIDLLHIDGLHTYEAVQHDFEEWLPKMNDKGVILLHDTMVRERNFGAWRLWNEVAPKYPSYNFTHGYGLGILVVGPNVSNDFLDFLNEANSNSFYQKLFFSLGMLCSFDAIVEEKDTRIGRLEEALNEKDTRIGRLEGAIREKDAYIQLIHLGHGWRLLTKYYKIRDRFLPVGSRRKNAVKLVWNFLNNLNRQNVRGDGFINFFCKMREVIMSSEPAVVDIVKYENSYQAWIKLNEPTQKELRFQSKKRFPFEPIISIIVPTFNTHVQLLRDMIESVRSQTYSNWELCIADGGSKSNQIREVLEEYTRKDTQIRVKFLDENKGIAGNCNEALSLASGEFVVLLDQHDLLSQFALFEIVRVINENPDTDFIYSDEDEISEDEKMRSDPHFKPDWSPDTLRSYNYISHLTVFKRELLEIIGVLRKEFDGSEDYDIILRGTERAKRIVHIPKVLYHRLNIRNSAAITPKTRLYAHESAKKALREHLSRIGLRGKVEDGHLLGTYKIAYEIEREPKVSIIIPNMDHVAYLKKCVSSILAKTIYKNYEIIIVENNSIEHEIFDYYEEISKRENIKVITLDRPFNFSSINNFGVAHAEGEYLLFLNNDLEIINPDWMERLLEHAVRKSVGVVGAKLYYPNSTIQHAGIVIGLGGIAGHIHRHRTKSYDGYLNCLKIIRNVSAVTGACMMVRREVFGSVGGFDENIKVNFSDVDICLRILQKGYLNIFTPFAELVHHEKVTRRILEASEILGQEMLYFKEKWGNILNKDFYFNVNIPLLDEKSVENFIDSLLGNKRDEMCKTNYLKTFEDVEKFYSYSIIVLNKDNPHLIKKCVDHIIMGGNTEKYEIIVGDTGSTDPETLAYYKKIKDICKIVYLPFYNFSKNNNELARLANNRILIFLNNDVFVPEKFLSNLGKFLIFPRVGIVGCKLLFEDGKIQHAGIEFVSEGPYKYLGYHPYRGKENNILETNAVRIVPAVTGSCLMIEKALFLKVGGFDENYQAECQDTDLCLNIQILGYHVLCTYTGETEAFHIENATRIKGEENRTDRRRFVETWKEYIGKTYLFPEFQSRTFNPKVLFIRERERGDVLASTAVIKEFRKRYPTAEIHFKTRYPDLLKNNKHIDILVDSFYRMQYDCIVDLTYEIGNWEGTWLETFFKCVGFRKSDINPQIQYPNFNIESDEEFRKTIPPKYIVLAPNAGWPQREWLYENFVELVKLIKKDLQIQVVQVGGEADRYVDGCIDFRGIFLNRLGILMSKASLFIGVDSFPMHMALAILPDKKNIIILTCPTSKSHVFMGEATEIRDNSCMPCRERFGEGLTVLRCQNPKLKAVPVDKVFVAVKQLLTY